jgi:hypothetical protein
MKGRVGFNYVESFQWLLYTSLSHQVPLSKKHSTALGHRYASRRLIQHWRALYLGIPVPYQAYQILNMTLIYDARSRPSTPHLALVGGHEAAASLGLYNYYYYC